MRCEVDNVFAQNESRMVNAILSPMDNLVILTVELAIDSVTPPQQVTLTVLC